MMCWSWKIYSSTTGSMQHLQWWMNMAIPICSYFHSGLFVRVSWCFWSLTYTFRQCKLVTRKSYQNQINHPTNPTIQRVESMVTGNFCQSQSFSPFHVGNFLTRSKPEKKRSEKNTNELETRTEKLIGAQPPPSCSFARHLVVKLVIQAQHKTDPPPKWRWSTCLNVPLLNVLDLIKIRLFFNPNCDGCYGCHQCHEDTSKVG